MDTATAPASFAALSLKAETLAALDAKGYRAPTPVQQEAIPRALEGRDLVVQSRTGTGKTAAFGVPIMEKVDPEREEVQALVLAPTRELALQVADELASLGRGRGIRIQSIYGGDSMERQLEGIRSGAHVIAGTPGRVLDHLRRRTLKLDACRTLVLDEADRMLDMGFAVEMAQIMEYVPAERQTLLFSATIPLGIRGLIYHYMAEPEWVLLSEDQVYVKEVEHLYCMTPRLHKEASLYKLIEYENPATSMVFCNTREETRQVYTFLAGKGLPCAMLSSDLPQKKRERVLAKFRAGEIRHLVTTDVASRGIDIEDLSHVFIFSSPDSPEQYIHRAGRTGRVGKSGRAISLVSAHDLLNFNRLVKRYHVEVKELLVPSDEEVQARKVERIVTQLAAEGQALPLEEFVEQGPVARRIAEHEHRDRIVALLLRRYLQPPAEEPEELEPLRGHAGTALRAAGGAAAGVETAATGTYVEAAMLETLAPLLAVALAVAPPAPDPEADLKRVVADYVGLYRRETLPQWRALFLPTFTVASTLADGSIRLRGLDEFYGAQERYLATGRAIEEKLENVAIERKGRLASAWADFVLTDEGERSRGKLCLLLVEEKGSWRIQSLVFAYDDANAP